MYYLLWKYPDDDSMVLSENSPYENISFLEDDLIELIEGNAGDLVWNVIEGKKLKAYATVEKTVRVTKLFFDRT